MKTIYLKAEVVEEGNNNTLIDINGNKIWCGSESIEQAQVLAVEEVLSEIDSIHDCDNIKQVENAGLRLWRDESGTLNGERFNSLSELTELVTGKERTLEDVNREIKELWDAEGVSEEWCIRIQELAKEAEQLLKNRE